MKRLLDCFASDLKKMDKKEILESIRASEGRIICAETTLVSDRPILEDVSDAELKSCLGADMILYNWLDVFHPSIPSVVAENAENAIREVKKLTGRLIGVNLEPVDEGAKTMGEIHKISQGRQASARSAKQAVKIGLDYILLTGNPGTGVTNKEVINSLKSIKEACGDEIILMAGKMHAAGSPEDAGEKIISKELIKQFAEAGADVICIPAPGTVPGISEQFVREMISYAHSIGALTMTAIGTSQEGAGKETICKIALMCKMCGADIHHIGDANVDNTDNLIFYGYTVRGVRHTLKSMAKSPNR